MTMAVRHLLVGLVLTAFALCAAVAAPAVDLQTDAALEDRVKRVSAELRCLVCQNQSLADSHADLALDLKRQVREQLQAGRSDDEVMHYMTERYGDFVRYRPVWKPATLLLWLGPALLLLALAALAWRQLAAHARPGDDRDDSDEDDVAAPDAGVSSAAAPAAAAPGRSMPPPPGSPPALPPRS
jgi:cytochrome c-type biogenesis protein CcmH